jgi:peptidoglycan/xylan/chitin deacetylase (PgdA/CDA1 family)
MSLKRSIVTGLHCLGAFGVARRMRTSRFLGATVLLYHRVMPASTPDDHYTRLMGDPTAPQLEALLRYLKRWFRFATPRDCVERWQQGAEVDPYTLLLTFDDGYADMHEQLLPVLRNCDVPATVFVATGAIGGGDGRPIWSQRLLAALERTARPELPSFADLPAMSLRESVQRVAVAEAVSAAQRRFPASIWESMIDTLCAGLGWDGQLGSERMMDWGQVDGLHRSGRVMVGGHTVSHPYLDQCDVAQARRETFDSAAELRERLRPEFLPFSYPHGRCPRKEVQDMVRAAGYDCAFTARWAANTRATHLYQLGRRYVPPDNLARASLLLSGLRDNRVPAVN